MKVGFTDNKFEYNLGVLKSNKSVSEENKKMIYEFSDYCFTRGYSQARISKYVYTLGRIAKMIGKKFDTVDKNDIMDFVRKIEQSDYADWTKHDYKVILKRFYKWINGDSEYPELVKWVKTTIKNGRHRLPEEILNEEDVIKLIESAEHPRDKAIVSVLYESGCRIGELGTLKIKHVNFDKYGAQIIVSGKTGMRRIRLISSMPYLSGWISNHPLRSNPDSPLWIGIGTRGRGKQITYMSVVKFLQNLSGKAKITKKVNPHAFRHARATHLANFLTEAQMKEFFGWVQASEMASVYVHLSGRDVDDALLKIHGIKSDNEKKEQKMCIQICPRCENKNPPTGKFCNRCGLPLDTKTAIEIEKKTDEANELMNELMQNPEIQKVLLEELLKKGLGSKLSKIFGDGRE